MKKLWIQYVVLILSAAVMLAVIPDFSDSIKSAQAKPNWQTDSVPEEEETEFGDWVLPIPSEEELSSAASDSSVESGFSALSSLFSSKLTSSKRVQSIGGSSSRQSSVLVTQDPTVSMSPIPSSQPISSAKPSNSSKPSSSSKADSSSASSSASTPSEAEKTVWVSINGKQQNVALLTILPQIVENEIGSSAEPEALKAQAVAAHTYIRYYNDREQAPAVSIKTVSNQAKVNAAVQAVADKIMTVNGKAVYTPYCAASAGKTNSSADVWGGALSHLVSVESKYDCQDTKNWGSEKKISIEEVRALLEEKGGITVSGEPKDWFKTINYTVGGYNKNMSVCRQTTCTIGGKKQTITGRVLRESILKLKSAKFEVAVEGDSFVFTTYGYGHGVGMPQIGANLYAKNEKWSYQQILTHYYTGVTITTLK